MGVFSLYTPKIMNRLGIIKLKEKGKGHYEVIYVIGHEELWGKVLGTEALKQALYTAFLFN